MSGVLVSGAAAKAVSTRASNCDVRNTNAVLRASEAINQRVVDLQNTHNIFANGAPRHAFVTFATPDYRWGVIAWLRSLRRVSDKPVFIFATKEIKIPEGIERVYVVIVPVLYEGGAVFKTEELRNMFTKLWIFSAFALDRVFYADADCVFLKPVDELFERDGFLVCPDYVADRKDLGFNAGVMIFSPSVGLRDQIFTQIAATSSRDGNDQKILNIVLRDNVTFISENYNLLRHFQYFGNIAPNNNVRILHFIIKKPWECPYREMPDAMLVDLDDIWTAFLSPEERLELIAEWRRSIFYLGERRRSDLQEFAPAIENVRELMLASEDRTKNRLKAIRSVARIQLVAIIALTIAVVAMLFLRP